MLDRAPSSLSAVLPARRADADTAKALATLRQLPLVETDRCTADPRGCAEACRTRTDPNGCFALALDLQANASAPEVAPLDGEMVFTRVCAGGRVIGCTNRAAGLLTPDKRVSFADKPDAERYACALRTFSLACDRDEPWGCTMLGTMHERGEGTPRDVAAARRFTKRPARCR